MNNYLSNRYIYRIIDHPFDLVELIARIWILVISSIVTLSALFTESISTSQLAYWFISSLTLFFIHLVCTRISPHRFHSPHVKSINVPLAETIRSNTVYLIVSSWYLANFILSMIGLIPNLDKLIYWDWAAKGINIFTVSVFLTVLLVYVGTIKPAFKRIPLSFLLNDLIILFSISLYFVYLLITNKSFEIAVDTFGKFLLGSITLIIARDLFIGKWTHDLPVADKQDK